jgi:prepilin-type N-terminal cleavage/methylation domain-containing protein
LRRDRQDCNTIVVAADIFEQNPEPSIGSAVAVRECMQRGFSLVEVIVATAVLCTAIIGIAQLSIVSMRMNRAARTTTVATVLARQRMEQLQSARWTELTTSPFAALDRNTAGYCDFLDGNGRMLAGGTSPPAAAAFVRRWSIDSLAAGGALLIQVSVGPAGSDAVGRDGVGSMDRRHLEEARIVGIKIRDR